VPTTAELGFPNVRVESNYGIIAPTSMPAAQTQRLHAALVATLAQPEVSKQLVSAGSTPLTNSPAEYRQLMEQESARWAAVVKKSNIKLD
jgi:tripartite-type tricarboxylate transporter receptor subunit TctC